jgi:hypothetical protein
MNEQRNAAEFDWDGEGVQIFKQEDMVRKDLQAKLEMLMPGIPKERVTSMVAMVENAKTPDFSWVPERARGPVMDEARRAAEAFDRIAVSKVQADLAREERAQEIAGLKKADEREREEVIATFHDQFAEQKQQTVKPKLSAEVKSKAGVLDLGEINRAVAAIRAKEEMDQPSVIVEDLEAMNKEAQKRRGERRSG